MGQVHSGALLRRNYVTKDINFGVGARAAILQGVSEVADAVKVTMGPKVLCFYFILFLLNFYYYLFIFYVSMYIVVVAIYAA